eukprot:gene5725-7908_t
MSSPSFKIDHINIISPKMMENRERNNSEDDFTRGYGINTNTYNINSMGKYNDEDNYNFDDVDDEYDDNDEEIKDDFPDKAPEMPEEFYKNIDNFLHRPHPTLKLNSKKKNSTKASNSNISKMERMEVPNLPKIGSEKIGKISIAESDLIGNQVDSINQSKSKGIVKKSIKAESNKSKQLNNHLLSEAFEYTDKLLKEALMEEAKQIELNNATQSRNNNTKHNYHQEDDIINSYRNNSEGGGLVKKLRSKTKQNTIKKSRSGSAASILQNSSTNNNIIKEFNVVNEKEIDLKKNALNFDDLVNNFQNGVTLQKLKAELAQSKQSMAKSEQFMRELSRNYINGIR